MIWNNQLYYAKGGTYVKEDANGNYVTYNSQIFTKRDDGMYDYNGKVYDEELKQITR